jgi:DNA-binding CsgD family transcriptional regulator
MVASGLPNKQVAQQLNVSARTVGSHLEHAYAKIGVSTRGAAAMYVMRHGLVPEKSVI